MADEILFCPFCGEAFEGDQLCPEHELPLVRWSELRRSEPSLPDDRELPWASLRFGRGLVAAGAALSLLAFVALPLARVEGELRMGGSMLLLALSGTPKLWLVPAAAWAELVILYRRRSPLAMRGARLAVALVACVPVVSALWTWAGAEEAVMLLAQRTRQHLDMRPGAGAYALCFAVAAMLAGAARLGVVARDPTS